MSTTSTRTSSTAPTDDVAPREGGEELVRAVGVERRYGSVSTAHTALQATDVVVRAGERIAVTGPSGSGKSTLVHLLAGLDRPSAGELTWPGLGGAHPLEQPGKVGVVFQAPSLLPALDVVENVELVALLAGVDPARARERAWSALEALELGHLAPALPEELSGGQAQRVVIARVLAGDPVMVLADEPTGQLDHVTAAHVLDVLEAAVDVSGAALVVATHDADVAARYRTRWAVQDGRLRTGPDGSRADPSSHATGATAGARR